MRPYIAGIAGESAGGKSALTKRLAEALSGYQVRTLHLDEYYRPETERPGVRPGTRAGFDLLQRLKAWRFVFHQLHQGMGRKLQNLMHLKCS